MIKLISKASCVRGKTRVMSNSFLDEECEWGECDCGEPDCEICGGSSKSLSELLKQGEETTVGNLGWFDDGAHPLSAIIRKNLGSKLVYFCNEEDSYLCEAAADLLDEEAVSKTEVKGDRDNEIIFAEVYTLSDGTKAVDAHIDGAVREIYFRRP